MTVNYFLVFLRKLTKMEGFEQMKGSLSERMKLNCAFSQKLGYIRNS